MERAICTVLPNDGNILTVWKVGLVSFEKLSDLETRADLKITKLSLYFLDKLLFRKSTCFVYQTEEHVT